MYRYRNLLKFLNTLFLKLKLLRSGISSLRGGLLAVLLEERLSEAGLCSGFRVAPGSEEVMRSPRVGQLAPDSEAVAPDDTGGLLR